jgi:hypothetical protein
MSASIHWRYLTSAPTIPVYAPSRFVEAMNEAFGTYPWRLKACHLERLWGMAAMNDDGAPDNPYLLIIDKIQSADGLANNEIEVWPEY